MYSCLEILVQVISNSNYREVDIEYLTQKDNNCQTQKDDNCRFFCKMYVLMRVRNVSMMRFFYESKANMLEKDIKIPDSQNSFSTKFI